MEYYVCLQEGQYTEGVNEETGAEEKTYHITSSVDIPMVDDQVQWEVWTSILDGYDQSPHWDRIDEYDESEEMYAFRHRDLRSVVVRLFMSTKN